jgi:hypothetical protein
LDPLVVIYFCTILKSDQSTTPNWWDRWWVNWMDQWFVIYFLLTIWYKSD